MNYGGVYKCSHPVVNIHQQNNNNNMSNEASDGCLGLIILLILLFILGAICWPYAINAWLVYAGKTAVVTWWQGGLIGIVPFVGKYGLPAAVLTWIILLFIL